MAKAEFRGVWKRFGQVVAVRDFTLGAGDGELVTILGPSGSGKSTLLRLAAGLEELSAGAIYLGERRIDPLPPRQRDVAMVFQNYALYPHMSVRENIEFPLRMRGVPRAARRRQVDRVAELLELGDLLDRMPAQLSGGQRQRVALARALVREPALFLLDEPLSNLDVRLRLSVRQYVREVQRRLGVTTLYVTHDQTEAMTLGDRVVVMDRGTVQQVGTPATIYEQPANAFVASFVGNPPMNLLPGAYGDGVLQVEDQRLPLGPEMRSRAANLGPRLLVGVRPEAFEAGREGTAPGLAAVPDPSTVEILGSETLVRARVGTRWVAVRLFGIARRVPPLVVAPPERLHFFPAEASGPQSRDSG